MPALLSLGLRLLKLTLLSAPIIALCLTLPASRTPSLLEKIRASGELEFITSNGPTTVYEGAEGLTGFEYELIRRFAQRIGVSARITQPGDLDAILKSLQAKPHAIAAAGIQATPRRAQILDFGPGYLTTSTLVISHQSQPVPESLGDLAGGLILVQRGSAQEEFMEEHQEDMPGLLWQALDVDQQDLIEKVHQQEAAYALVDRNTFEQSQVLFAKAKSAFALTAQESLAWAFAPQQDKTLQQEVEAFFSEISRDGTLTQLYNSFYQAPLEPDQNIAYFNTLIEERLVHWRDAIQAAARTHQLDWFTLAAVGYEESHWNPNATSETGVRGFMMLTTLTAKAMQVHDRVDPYQSIEGGARLLRYLLNKLPQSLPESDRLALALAAYNLGLGHLYDAQRLATQAGKNPMAWQDVKEVLPLLGQRRYYTQTKHGFARGKGAVIYVENILRHRELLALHEQENQRQALAATSRPAPRTWQDVDPQISDAIDALVPSKAL